MRNRGGRDGRNAEGEKKRTRGKNGSNSYPKPLDLPLVWSTIICASVTAPNCLKYSRNSPAFCFLLLEKKREREVRAFFPPIERRRPRRKKNGGKKKENSLTSARRRGQTSDKHLLRPVLRRQRYRRAALSPFPPRSGLAGHRLFGVDPRSVDLVRRGGPAASASSSSKKVTKPKPRELRVMRSRMTVCCVVFWMRVLRGR